MWKLQVPVVLWAAHELVEFVLVSEVVEFLPVLHHQLRVTRDDRLVPE